MNFDSLTGAVVVGVGNEVRSDDGLGVVAARLIEQDKRLPENTSVLHGATLGLELLPYLRKASHLFFVDAIDTGAPPGRIAQMTEKGLQQLPGSSNAHQLGVADLLTALRLVRDDEPEVTILGMQPQSTDWGVELSPEVAQQMPALVDRVIQALCTSKRQT